MKKPFRLILIAVCAMLSIAANGFSQGFINFDFENATVVDLPAGQWEFVSITDALPGWTGYLGANPVAALATHNSVTLGSVNVGILGPNLSPGTGNLLDHYTAVLQAGIDLNGDYVSATISQTALVPVTAQSLLFQTGLGLQNPNHISVTLNGQSVPLSLLGATSTRNFWEGNISAFSGQTATLAISSLPVSVPGNGFTLDNIAFGVPEPGTLGLFGFGALLLGWRMRGKPHQ